MGIDTGYGVWDLVFAELKVEGLSMKVLGVEWLRVYMLETDTKGVYIKGDGE